MSHTEIVVYAAISGLVLICILSVLTELFRDWWKRRK